MEDYLTGVLLSEMPVDFSPEARKAQVVAARTFTCRKLESPKHTQADVCADFACCQAWTSRGDLERKYGDDFTAVWQSAQELVRESAGEVLTFGGELIDAVYFSISMLINNKTPWRRDGSGSRSLGNGRAVFAVGRESRRRNRAPVFFARDFRTRGIFRDSAR